MPLRLAHTSLLPVLRLLPKPALAADDADLVIRAQRGEDDAVRLLYERHVQSLGALCLRLLRNRADAEEVVQESFVVAFQRLRDLREPASFRTWLTTIAVRKVRSKRRRERFLAALGFGAVEIPLELLAGKSAPEEARSELRALDAALATLPEPQRLVWLLRHIDEEPLEAIADAAGCSLATAKRWIRSAEQHLEQHLEERT